MELRRIVIATHDRKRIVLYPEGGWDIECFVTGPGWVLDNDADIMEPELSAAIVALFKRAAQVTADAAALCSAVETGESGEPAAQS